MTKHRHCEIEKCYELATQEVGASRDTHQKFGAWQVKLWVCPGHIAEGLTIVANRILKSPDIFNWREIKVQVGGK